MGYRLLFVWIFLMLLMTGSCAQKTAGKTITPTKITKKITDRESLMHDSTFLSMLSKMYGDGVSINIDSLLKDTSFFKVSFDVGPASTVPQQYNVQFSIKPLGWVSDYEDVFSPAQVAELDSAISSFEKATTNEIAIVTIDSSWITKGKFDSLIVAIHNNWGVGKKDINNGVVIGISTGLKMIRISNGYGIETRLTDAETKKIIDNIILPDFREGKYFEGTMRGLSALMEKIR